MTNSKTTKRALLSSVMALILCFTMLLGTTFAWFTDSAASGSNVITAGNLDIVVEYTLGDKNTDGNLVWVNLDGAKNLFQKGLWEPGHTEVVALRITNNGTLALKYAANMNIVSETVGKTKDNKNIVLSDILTVSTLVKQAIDENGNANQDGTIALGQAFKGESSVAYEQTSTFKAGNVLGNDQELQPGAAHYLIVKVDMAESVGNEANHDGKNAPTINFGIDVRATQHTYEEDTFGKDYDEDAVYATYTYDSSVMGGLYDLLPTLKSGDVLILPAGTYTISGSLTIPSGVTIKGAEGAEVIIRQNSEAQDNIFNCKGDVVIENITFESNRKGYAITDNTKNHDTDGDITIINCKFKGLATEKNWGVYKNLNGNLTIKNCTFDNYNNAICGVNNGSGSTTEITGCAFTNISDEAIGYVASSMPANFEDQVIANNTGLTTENVIGY